MFTTLVLMGAHECTTHQIEGKYLFYSLWKFGQVGPNTSWLNQEISKNLVSDEILFLWMFTTLVLMGAHECTTHQIEGKDLFYNLWKFEQVGQNSSRFSIQYSCLGWFFECLQLWFEWEHMNVQPLKLKENISSWTLQRLSKLGQIHPGFQSNILVSLLLECSQLWF